MAQTDRQTDKSSRWAFTAYEDQWSLFETIPPGIAEWGWNAEICPKTNRKHYQGYIRLAQQQRFTWLRKILPGVHLEISRNWDALLLYCRKEDTRISGTEPVARTNSILTHFQYAEELAKRYVQTYGVDDHPRWVWKVTPIRDAISIQRRLDDLAEEDIRAGRRFTAWIVTNPAWNTMWSKFFKSFILSFSSINDAPAQAIRTSVTPSDGESQKGSSQGEQELN